MGQSATTTLRLDGTSIPAGGIEFDRLVDVSTIEVDYRTTSWNQQNKTLYADLSIRNSGTYEIAAPLLVGVKNISAAGVLPVDIAGYTPGGMPYYDFSSLINGNVLSPQQVTDLGTLAFHNPDQVPFTYDLVLLGALNRTPSFVTAPEVNATVGLPYQYDFAAIDPDGDTVSYQLLAGPSGAVFDDVAGTLSWTPTSADVGNHEIVIEASDIYRGRSLQQYTLSASKPSSVNRPPLFTTLPIVIAQVGVGYTYDAAAGDADHDVVTITLTDDVSSTLPAGLAIGATTNNTATVSWTPTADQVGTHSLVLVADDGSGGITRQPYTIEVIPTAGNHDPVFVSTPLTAGVAGVDYRYAAKAIDADIGDTITYSLLTSPAGMTIDAATGIIDWPNPAATMQPETIVVRALDTRGGSALHEYSLDIVDTTPVTLSGIVFDDANGDQTQSGGELGIAGRTLILDTNANNMADPGERTVVTAADGSYSFVNVTPGPYRVALSRTGEYAVNAPLAGAHAADAAAGGLISGLNFALVVRSSGNQRPEFVSSPPRTAAVGEP
ncbi:MAG: putative Ig domain-containing protein, partial [Pirellulales bacterium]|nr:putative Ig domain-containing protein [Pirellulales bacterium]